MFRTYPYASDFVWLLVTVPISCSSVADLYGPPRPWSTGSSELTEAGSGNVPAPAPTVPAELTEDAEHLSGKGDDPAAPHSPDKTSTGDEKPDTVTTEADDSPRQSNADKTIDVKGPAEMGHGSQDTEDDFRTDAGDPPGVDTEDLPQCPDQAFFRLKVKMFRHGIFKNRL